jgi:hypothetical protein
MGLKLLLTRMYKEEDDLYVTTEFSQFKENNKDLLKETIHALNNTSVLFKLLKTSAHRTKG